MLPSLLKQSSIKKSIDVPLLQDDVLITNIAEEEQSPKQKISAKNYQVYMIEDSTPPTSFPANQQYTSLPSTVEFSRIVANVITSLSTSYFKQI